MKKLLPILLMLAISGCSNPPKQTPNGSLHTGYMSFVGASNDLLPGVRTPEISTDIFETRGDIRRTTFPLTYAVACNTDKTECKHAVVGTEIRARYTIDQSGRLHISGILQSEMGRSVSFDGGAYKETMSVSDSVPVIATQSEETMFDAYLGQGEKLTLDGFAGVEVTISRR